MKCLLRVLLIGVLLCGLSSCGKKGEQTKFPREKTLYLAGFQWGDPNTFNPLTDWPAFPVSGPNNIMYEPLIIYNTLSGTIEPLLARLDEKTDDYISLILNPEARWSDKEPLTAEDVVFTYEIGKEHESVPTSYVWDFISKITTEKIVDSSAGNVVAEKIVFHVNKEKENNPLGLLDILQSVQIVPKHIIVPLLEKHNNDFSEFQKEMMDKNPVVSGPYTLFSYSVQKIVLKRVDDYWGNKALHNNRMAKPEYIIHPIYKSNDQFSNSLKRGNLDVNSNFIPRIWLKFKDGVGSWYDEPPYFVPASIPVFIINVTRNPLNDREYRRAMAYAINYKDVIELAVSQYSPELKPGLILPFGTEKKYYSEEIAEEYGKTYDPEKAKKILEDAGYKSIFKNGELEKVVNSKGEKVPPVFIKCPVGWSDWESIVEIAVKSMREVGIDAREGFCDESLYWKCQPIGDFDLLMTTPADHLTPSLPWARFEQLMSSRRWKPEGKKMNENQGRYNNPDSKDYNPAVDSLLKVIPHLTKEDEIKAAYYKLNKIFIEDMPSIPLCYRPEEFYDFSTKHWTNFATEKNPYAPPQLPSFGAGRNMLWEIQLAE